MLCFSGGLLARGVCLRVLVHGIASFELLCAWRFRFQARASCATKTCSLSSGLGVEGTSCSRSHNPGGTTAMLRQGPLFNLSDVSLRIRRTSFSWTTVHEISRTGTTRPPPRLPPAWHVWPRLFRFWVLVGPSSLDQKKIPEARRLSGKHAGMTAALTLLFAVA